MDSSQRREHSVAPQYRSLRVIYCRANSQEARLLYLRERTRKWRSGAAEMGRLSGIQVEEQFELRGLLLNE
jgi:hypothetical protein